VKVVAEVAGSPALPAVEIDIELACNGSPANDPSDGGTGCSVARGPQSARWTGVFGLLLVLGAALDRPRRRR